MKHINISVNITPIQSVAVRFWCNENGIEYSITGQSFEDMEEFDKDISIYAMTKILCANEVMPLGFQFKTEEDATAFKLRWS